MQRAVGQIPGQHTPAGAVIVHQQVDGEIFDEKLGVMLERLLVERVQNGVAGAVGGSAGALGRALAVVRGHATKWTLINLAFLGSGKRHAEMLQFNDGLDRKSTRLNSSHVAI